MIFGQFKQSLDSFYVTDSPLRVTNLAEMAMFYIKLTSLIELVQPVSLNKVLTFAMLQIVF